MGKNVYQNVIINVLLFIHHQLPLGIIKNSKLYTKKPCNLIYHQHKENPSNKKNLHKTSKVSLQILYDRRAK